MANGNGFFDKQTVAVISTIALAAGGQGFVTSSQFADAAAQIRAERKELVADMRAEREEMAAQMRTQFGTVAMQIQRDLDRLEHLQEQLDERMRTLEKSRWTPPP